MEKSVQHRYDMLKVHLSQLSGELAHLDKGWQDAALINDIENESVLMGKEHEVLIEIHETIMQLAEIIARARQERGFLRSELPLFSGLGEKKA